MQVHQGGGTQSSLQLLHQGISVVGQQQVGHVLDADVVSAHLFQLQSQFNEVFFGVNGADGVRQSNFADAAVLLGGLDAGFQVTGIVQGVEDADNVDAVLDGQTNELIYDVVSVVTIAQDVLAAEEHLQLGVRQSSLQLAQALPGIFVQETQAAVKGSAAPAFQRIETSLVQDFASGQHVLQAHTGCGLRLMCVAKDGFGNHYFAHNVFLLAFKRETIWRSARCRNAAAADEIFTYANREMNTPAATAEPITPATLGPMAFISRKLPGSYS